MKRSVVLDSQSSANELILGIRNCQKDSDVLSRAITANEQEKSKIENDLRILTQRLEIITSDISKQMDNKAEYDRIIEVTKQEYTKIQESSKLILTRLKESESIINKSQS